MRFEYDNLKMQLTINNFVFGKDDRMCVEYMGDNEPRPLYMWPYLIALVTKDEDVLSKFTLELDLQYALSYTIHGNFDGDIQTLIDTLNDSTNPIPKNIEHDVLGQEAYAIIKNAGPTTINLTNLIDHDATIIYMNDLIKKHQSISMELERDII